MDATRKPPSKAAEAPAEAPAGATVTGDPLSAEDRSILEGVDKALADAVDLELWWHEAHSKNAYHERFPLFSTHNRPDESFGFFAAADVGGVEMSVMGTVLEQLFDRPKLVSDRGATTTDSGGQEAGDWINRQIQEFVLRYFLRISDFRQPKALPGGAPEPPPAPWPLAWHAAEEGTRDGFGFEQVYIKRKDENEARRVSKDDRFHIVDLRQIGTVYEWVVVKVDIFDLNLVFAPFGEDLPYGTLPRTEHSYLVLHESFVVNDEEPESLDELGRYGFGYAFIPAPEESLLSYGPGRFEAAFQSIRFRVGRSGEVTTQMVFVANRPDKVVNVSLDPVTWGLRMADFFSMGAASPVTGPMQKMWDKMPGPGGDVLQRSLDLADRLTGGGAARNLGVSRKQHHKNFLGAHFAQAYNVIAGSLLTWRRVPDWLDREKLPTWVVSGRSP